MRRVSLLTLALAACVSAPAYRPPSVAVPASFRESGDSVVSPVASAPSTPDTALSEMAASQVEFWQELGDTTLDRLVQQAIGANLDVQVAMARIQGARAGQLNAALDLAPTITFAGGYTRQQLSTATFPVAGVAFPADIWDGGFDASWEIDLFGRLRRNLQGRGALVAAATEDLYDVQVSLVADLARAYFELRGAQEQLAVARLNADNQRQTFEVTQHRLDAGEGTAFDTERAQAQLSSTLASIPTLEAQVAADQYRIAVLVGRPPAGVVQELTRATELPSLPATFQVAPPDSMIRHRPDVAAAERQLAAQRSFVSAAKADYLPRLTVGGSTGLSATTFDSLGESGSFRYAVGPVISWPAFNLGRVKAQVDAARANEAEAQARYTQTVLRALQEVETALARYRASRERVERLQEAASASERAAELARLRFSEGVADFLPVLDAERTQLDAQSQLAQGRADAATSYAALYKALGGSWPMTPSEGDGP